MQLDLGSKIRSFRRSQGHTQEALATALGVTSQAVSRWESGSSYPDMNLLPCIANYFNITIDELFGYTSNRHQRIAETTAHIRRLLAQNDGRNVNINECIRLAREALVEFPGNEQVMLCLADVLFQAGYVRHGEHHLLDSDGYTVYDTQRHSAYAEWSEAIALYQKALATLHDVPLRRRALQQLTQLYVNVGACDKALALADDAPDIMNCREFLRIRGCDGKQQARAYGEALLAAARSCAETMVQAVLVNQQHMSPAEKIQAISNALRMLECICTDGNLGEHHAYVGKLHMLLSAFLWLDGQKDAAFSALTSALTHFKIYEGLARKGVCVYTAPLLRLVKANIPALHASITTRLPEDWPWWLIPEAEAIRAEMSGDPRWQAWVTAAQA